MTKYRVGMGKTLNVERVECGDLEEAKKVCLGMARQKAALRSPPPEVALYGPDGFGVWRAHPTSKTFLGDYGSYWPQLMEFRDVNDAETDALNELHGCIIACIGTDTRVSIRNGLDDAYEVGRRSGLDSMQDATLELATRRKEVAELRAGVDGRRRVVEDLERELATEINGRRTLSERHGARANEGFTDFVDRLAHERDQAQVQVSRLTQEHRTERDRANEKIEGLKLEVKSMHGSRRELHYKVKQLEAEIQAKGSECIQSDSLMALGKRIEALETLTNRLRAEGDDGEKV